MSSISGYNAATVSTLNSGEYHHMALSISGTWHTLYLDGVQVAQNLSGGNVFASYTSAVPNLYIGCAGDLSYGFAGSIDDFKIWNRVLPTTDISSIYWSQYVPKTGPLDSLSTSAKSSMIYSGTRLSAGAYGTKLLYSAYKGPMMRIRNNLDTSQTNLTDFYADTNGNLGTAYLASGTSLAAWLSAAGASYAYVTIWYDQTGNGNNGTQTNTTYQPVFNQTYKYIDFGGSTPGGSYGNPAGSNYGNYFNLPDNTVPSGDNPFTITLKHGVTVALNTFTPPCYIGSGISPTGGSAGSSNSVCLFTSGNYYMFGWSNDLAGTNNKYVPNNVITFNYIQGTSRNIYVNGTLDATGASSNRNASTSYNYIGWNGYNGHYAMNGPMYYLYIAPSAFSDADRIILEATIANDANLVVYYPLNGTTRELISSSTVSSASTVTYATTVVTVNTDSGRSGLVCTNATYSASSTNIITNVNIPSLNLVGTGSGYSFSFWVYQTNFSTTAESVAFSMMNASLSGYQVKAVNNTLFVYYNFNSGSTLNCSGTLTNNAWNHVVFVVNSDQTTSLYINNVNVSNNATAYPSSMSIGSGNLIGIGCDNNYSRGGWTGTGVVYNGYISELGIYNIPLSAAKVTEIYTKG